MAHGAGWDRRARGRAGAVLAILRRPSNRLKRELVAQAAPSDPICAATSSGRLACGKRPRGVLSCAAPLPRSDGSWHLSSCLTWNSRGHRGVTGDGDLFPPGICGDDLPPQQLPVAEELQRPFHIFSGARRLHHAQLQYRLACPATYTTAPDRGGPAPSRTTCSNRPRRHHSPDGRIVYAPRSAPRFTSGGGADRSLRAMSTCGAPNADPLYASSVDPRHRHSLQAPALAVDRETTVRGGGGDPRPFHVAVEAHWFQPEVTPPPKSLFFRRLCRLAWFVPVIAGAIRGRWTAPAAAGSPIRKCGFGPIQLMSYDRLDLNRRRHRPPRHPGRPLAVIIWSRPLCRILVN